MAIDIGRGIQRIYIVLSVVWIVSFLFLAYNTLPPKILDRYKVSENLCEEFQKSYETGFDTRIKNLEGNSIYLWGEGLKKYIPYSEVLNRPNEYELYDVRGKECYMRQFRSFKQRFKRNDSGLYLLIASAPIPLYFILLFIVRGFRKKDK